MPNSVTEVEKHSDEATRMKYGPDRVACAAAFRWPDDYTRLDEGRLWVRPDVVELFLELGWTTVEAVLRDERQRVWRRLAHRHNATLQLERSGEPAVHGHLKCHVGNGLWGWLREWLAGGTGLPPGLAEAAAVGGCQSAGVATMQVLAAGATAESLPWRRRSFFLSEHLGSARPADDFWNAHFFEPLPDRSERRRAFLEALADAARSFHQAGCYHRDFYWCHFLIAEPAGGHFTVHLIDLQRVGRPRWFAWRWRLKDLAQFFFSVPAGVTEAEKRAIYRRYCGAQKLGPVQRLFYRLVQGRAVLYRWKERRR